MILSDYENKINEITTNDKDNENIMRKILLNYIYIIMEMNMKM